MYLFDGSVDVSYVVVEINVFVGVMFFYVLVVEYGSFMGDFWVRGGDYVIFV